MAINSNSGSSAGATNGIGRIGTAIADDIELETLAKPFPTALATTTPILKRKSGGGSKRLQFSTPEFSVTPIATIPGINNNRLLPSRRR